MFSHACTCSNNCLLLHGGARSLHRTGTSEFMAFTANSLFAVCPPPSACLPSAFSLVLSLSISPPSSLARSLTPRHDPIVLCLHDPRGQGATGGARAREAQRPRRGCRCGRVGADAQGTSRHARIGIENGVGAWPGPVGATGLWVSRSWQVFSRVRICKNGPVSPVVTVVEELSLQSTGPKSSIRCGPDDFR